MQFHLRINGRRADISAAPPVELNDWLTQAAQAVLREADPYILASYLFDTDQEAARKEVKNIIVTAPEKSELQARAYNLYGLILIEDKKFDEAMETFNKLLSINRKASYAFLNLGNVLAEQGQYAEASEHYRKASELNPKDARFYFNLGNVLADQGQHAEASEHYRKAIELDPKNTDAYYNLGFVLERVVESLRHAGKTHEAEDKLAEACRIFYQISIWAPDNQNYRTRLHRVNSLLPSGKKCIQE